jgi:hypothetical protein
MVADRDPGGTGRRARLPACQVPHPLASGPRTGPHPTGAAR